MHEVQEKSLLLVGFLGIWRTPEWVGDIARSVLVLSAIINIWGGAQRRFLKRICDVEEWCLKIGFKKVKITQVKCLHEKNLGDRNVYNDKSDYWQLLQQEWFEGIGTVVCVACRRSDLESDRLSTRRSKTQLPWFSTVVMIIIVLLLVFFGRVGFFILVFVLSIIAFHVIIY